MLKTISLGKMHFLNIYMISGNSMISLSCESRNLTKIYFAVSIVSAVRFW